MTVLRSVTMTCNFPHYSMTVTKCNDGVLLPTLQYYDCVTKCNDGMLLPTLQYDCVMKCNDGVLLPTLQYYDCVTMACYFPHYSMTVL